jgi:hypothetical protein
VDKLGIPMIALAPYAIRLIMGAALLAGIGGGFLFVKVHYENIGYEKAISKIAAKDEKAVDDVRAAKNKVDECFNSGRNWDAVRGLCV